MGGEEPFDGLGGPAFVVVHHHDRGALGGQPVAHGAPDAGPGAAGDQRDPALEAPAHVRGRAVARNLMWTSPGAENTLTQTPGCNSKFEVRLRAHTPSHHPTSAAAYGAVRRATSRAVPDPRTAFSRA